MKKKGISVVLVTILLVLVGMIAVGIFWGAMHHFADYTIYKKECKFASAPYVQNFIDKTTIVVNLKDNYLLEDIGLIASKKAINNSAYCVSQLCQLKNYKIVDLKVNSTSKIYNISVTYFIFKDTTKCEYVEVNKLIIENKEELTYHPFEINQELLDDYCKCSECPDTENCFIEDNRCGCHVGAFIDGKNLEIGEDGFFGCQKYKCGDYLVEKR